MLMKEKPGSASFLAGFLSARCLLDAIFDIIMWALICTEKSQL